MKIIDLINKYSNEKVTYYFLFSLNIIVSLIVFHFSAKHIFQDEKGYLLLSESILEGKFSTWYTLPKYYPETLRTPGYPMFLAFCQLFSKSLFFVKIIQLVLYFISIHLCTLIIKIINTNLIFRNLFLVLLIPNVQVVYYTGYISAEIFTVFSLVLSMYLIFSKKNWVNSTLLALTCYLTFISRPAFLLYPFVLIIYFIIQNRKDIKFSIFFISIYTLLLIPFGIWNKCNHGIFKITPIEGGAGVAHIGYWQLKLPDGYQEDFYWGNTTGYDYLKPNFFTKNEIYKYQQEFEKEWIQLLRQLTIYESKEDSSYIVYMTNNNPGIFILHNSKYTIEREKTLWAVTKQNIINDPIYYLNSRIFHLFRYYVIGINSINGIENQTLLEKIKSLYPFLITFIFIFLGLVFITVSMVNKKLHFTNVFAFLLLFWYYGAIHIPFSIQARYTLPIHLLLLAILAVTILKHTKKYQD